MGIADNPVTSLTVTAKIRNLRTNTDVQTIDLGTVTSSQDLSGSTTNVTVTANTPYVVIVYTDFAGHGENNPMSINCYMTGGTYTPTNTVFDRGSTGCFTISPRTPQDIRSCLCGRNSFYTAAGRTPQQIAADDQQNIQDRIALGCAD